MGRLQLDDVVKYSQEVANGHALENETDDQSSDQGMFAKKMFRLMNTMDRCCSPEALCIGDLSQAAEADSLSLWTRARNVCSDLLSWGTADVDSEQAPFDDRGIGSWRDGLAY